MELVANVWPVVDSGTGIVQRYFIRAYAMDAPDEVIGETLRTLAGTDFLIANVYQIPSRFTLESEHGSLSGAVPINLFHEYMQDILEPAYRELEKCFAQLQGIEVSDSFESPRVVNTIPKFPNDPYTVTTSIIENDCGELSPKINF